MSAKCCASFEFETWRPGIFLGFPYGYKIGNLRFRNLLRRPPPPPPPPPLDRVKPFAPPPPLLKGGKLLC